MRRQAGLVAFLIVLLGLSSCAIASAASSPSYPVLPIAESNALLSNLSAPTLAPGGSGPLGFELSDPLAGPMSGVDLSFEVYEFNAFPGNATSPPPSGASPVFMGANANGSQTSVSIARIGPGSVFRAPGNLSISILAPPGTPSGTFAIRVALTFSEDSQSYRFESRGYFSTAAWTNATTLPNGTPTLNVTRLGVSGVVPETAVLVRASEISPILYGILGGSLVLAAVGGYLAWRRGPGSRSGNWAPPEPRSAPKAFGNSRRSDGD